MPMYFCGKTRLIILLLSTVGLTIMMSNTLVWNMAQICVKNDTEKFLEHESDFLLAGAYYGCLLGALPITYITNTYGTRVMFTGYGLVGAIATAATPPLYRFGFWPMLALRIIQGVPIAAMFVSMASITRQWSPLNTTGLYLSWMSCNIQFAAIFTMLATGYLCGTAIGWQSSYYIHAGLSFLVFAAFFLIFRDSPRQHRNVSTAELAEIERGKSRDSTDRQVPYTQMLLDPMIWVILLATFTGLFAIYLMIQYAPRYLEEALHENVEKVGFTAAAPYALSCAVKLIAGPLSDRCACLSERTRIILFASVSQLMMAASYVMLANFTESTSLVRLCYTLIVVGSGLNVVGVLKSAQEISRCYSHVIMAWVVIITGVINGLLLPAAVSLFVPEKNDIAQWGRLFIFTACLILVGSVIFIFTIDVTPRNWAVQTAAPATNTPPGPLTPVTPSTAQEEHVKTARKLSA